MLEKNWVMSSLPKCFLIRLWLEAIVEQLGDLLLHCTALEAAGWMLAVVQLHALMKLFAP